MSEKPSIPIAERAVSVLREAGEPLTADQFLERLPPEVRTANTNPRRWLQQAVLSRPEVGRAGRGVYVYLPAHITGSTLRVPITGLEPQDSYLRLGHEVAYALWYRSVNWRWLQRGVTASCELPGGQASVITCEDVDDVGPLVTAGNELLDWLREERVAAGDSLLWEVRDAETRVCRLTLERLSPRDGPRVSERNRQLADAAVRVLREARGQRLPFDLTSWLLASDFYHDECPPDLLLLVLLLVDDRFTMDRGGEIGLATKWDRRDRWDPEYREAVEQIEREIAAEKQSKGAVREPFHGLGRWIDAVGLSAGMAAQTGEAPETRTKAWARTSTKPTSSTASSLAQA